MTMKKVGQLPAEANAPFGTSVRARGVKKTGKGWVTQRLARNRSSVKIIRSLKEAAENSRQLFYDSINMKKGAGGGAGE